VTAPTYPLVLSTVLRIQALVMAAGRRTMKAVASAAAIARQA
jgi:hypothetical protein